MKRRKRTSKYRKACIALVLLSTVLLGTGKLFALGSDRGIATWLSNLFDQTSKQTGEELYSPQAILVRLSDGRVLLDKNSGQRIYPASLTKMMTVLVVLEELDDLDTKVPLPQSMFQRLYEQDASLAGFLPGETVPAKDLLYGAMLPSGAECCVGLAQHLAGSEEEFVRKMNQKAAALGMGQTHFMNSTGLHDQNHFSTAADLSILLRYALKNPAFRKIFTAARYSTGPTNLHPNGITFSSTLYQAADSTLLQSVPILGGKTGYTNQAGLCLASLAQRKGEEYIFISAGAAGNHQTKQYHITDALSAYNKIAK